MWEGENKLKVSESLNDDVKERGVHRKKQKYEQANEKEIKYIVTGIAF